MATTPAATHGQTLPALMDGDGSWRDNAACRGQDTDRFFGPIDIQIYMAAKFCDRCPVAVDCRQAADGTPYGLWGGLPEGARGRSTFPGKKAGLARRRATARSAYLICRSADGCDKTVSKGGLCSGHFGEQAA